MKRSPRLSGLVTTVSLGILVAAAGAGGFMTYRTFRQAERARLEERLARRQAAWTHLEEQIDADLRGFPGQVGIVIKDLRTDWQIARHDEQPLPAASVIKIAIMADCFEAIQAGRLRLDEALTITAADRVGGSGQLKHRAAGASVTVEELLQVMIADSDNIASNMLIRRLGLPALQASFESMGLRRTSLVRKMMDFRARARGVENYTTAADVALLLERLHRGQLISRAWSDRGLALLQQQHVRDRIPARLPPEIVVAHKTGLENHVCHDAGIIYTPRGELLVVVLTKHPNKTAQRAKAFIAAVALHAYQYLVP